ncbi:hypothetical protein CC85DRAFT_284246 [Cutaneotrichosporon oleaginosum]|uniref:Uncharacterized protein n=1 Tax=Cutaneotrichosporon oleaginosum TaxID=879819 RepID=A0A0J0XRL7_9TREE|nr:uncharacterized protein CC85DRAFT_284246 [Cutaneotrichosporon oleaginosum]KLT43735.1 hypothetical protein CC85DRAFT_284246 [Cutaneotrichosporon oleaginosum]TXT05152.1 hypothetical protein COLE_06472 [Cutaneotrichosporon oleaginosum]
MPFRTSASDTWPRSQPPSYRVQPPTPARASPATTPRRREVWETPSGSPAGSGTSTPRRGHAHKMSTSSSTHSLRHSSSNSSLRGGGMSRSGSHSSLGPTPSYSYIPRSRSNHGLAHSQVPSPVTEGMEMVDPVDLRPSPPSSHLASSGSASEPLSDEYDTDELQEMQDMEAEAEFDPPCQFYGYPASETPTLYAPSGCACAHCVPVHTHARPHAPSGGYDMVLAPEHALHYPHGAHHSHQSFSTPPPPRGMLTGFAHRLFYQYVAPYLPEDIQAIIADPPDLRRPDSLIPLLRVVAPYAQYLIFLLALYIVYAFVTGMVSYTARFIRFCFRIGPVIAIIAWIMAASGQGGIEVVYEALKAYAGLTPADGGAAGRARAAAGAGAGGGRRTRAGTHYANPRTRTHRAAHKEPQPDILSAIFGNPATGQDGIGATVQDYVRAAVTKGLGLEWLVGKKEDGKKAKTR